MVIAFIAIFNAFQMIFLKPIKPSNIMKIFEIIFSVSILVMMIYYFTQIFSAE